MITNKYDIDDTVYFFSNNILRKSKIVAIEFLKETGIQYFVFGFWIEEKYLYDTIQDALLSDEANDSTLLNN